MPENRNSNENNQQILSLFEGSDDLENHQNEETDTEEPITTEEIIDEELFSEEELNEIIFYSIKTGDPTTVEAISDLNNPIEILQLNRFRNELEIGQTIFLVFGGDKSKPSVTWETGFIAIGHITREPYDIGYSGNNFKLQVQVDILLEDNIKKEDLVPYISTYNMPGISPMTKGEPNQALSSITRGQAVGLIRATLDKYPDLEHELTSIFGNRFMINVKNTITYLVEQNFTFEERLRQIDAEDERETPTTYVDSYEPNIDNIKGSFEMETSPLEYLKNYINIGKNIILTGPPGTGKTTIAERAAEEGRRTQYIDGFILSTATDDWSTFDTIGGYMPDPNEGGKLKFHEGIVLKSIKQNKWIIIDELNRADIDKAFGQLFTVLSGKDVELQFETNGQAIKINHYNGKKSYYDDSSSTYYIGRNWRIVGTMNSFDKNSLFAFSYAFMRRFAFIEISIPDLSFYSNIINGNSGLTQENKEFVHKLVEITPKPLGPAIVLELMDYIIIANNSSRIEAICGTVIPQYEGLDYNEILGLYKHLGPLLTVQEIGRASCRERV